MNVALTRLKPSLRRRSAATFDMDACPWFISMRAGVAAGPLLYSDVLRRHRQRSSFSDAGHDQLTWHLPSLGRRICAGGGWHSQCVLGVSPLLHQHHAPPGLRPELLGAVSAHCQPRQCYAAAGALSTQHIGRNGLVIYSICYVAAAATAFRPTTGTRARPKLR